MNKDFNNCLKTKYFFLQAEDRNVPTSAVRVRAKVRPVVHGGLRTAELGDQCAAKTLSGGQG